MRRMMLLASVAVFAADCATPQPTQIAYDRPDLVGPPGATGPTGLAGPQGPTGPVGQQGYALSGPPGEIGPQGLRGQQGNVGQTGAPGAVVVGARGDTGAVGPVGAHGSMAPRGFSQGERDLSNLRADSVREALMQAGVPSHKIQMGAFADPSRLRQDQIQVLIKTRV